MTATHAPHPMLKLAPEVAEALAAGTPVVALESTIISHGMPYPQNVAMAREVEQIVRDGGAVPATIAVLDGRPTIGLDDDELELLGSDGDIRKVSVRDLPYVVATGAHGATTVASTMRIAGLAGIRVFVTGGLGGVHRGAESSMDVSADLTELSRTEVAVISAGVKSILDIERTLEVLETLGVPVVGYGTDEFPSFFSRSSGVAVPMRLDTPEEVAALMAATWDLGLGSGVSIANPVPAAGRDGRTTRSTPSSSRPSPTATRTASAARTSRPTCWAGSSSCRTAARCETNLALVRQQRPGRHGHRGGVRRRLRACRTSRPAPCGRQSEPPVTCEVAGYRGPS